MQEICYQRRLGKNYMVIEETNIYQGFEVGMLLNQEICGLLPIETMVKNKKIQYHYLISGRISLAEYIKTSTTSKHLVRNLILSYKKVVEEIGEYLLKEEGISLLPETIFLGHDRKTISFCYLFGEHSHEAIKLKELLEYLIEHMNGNEEESMLCYHLYEVVGNGQYGITDLVDVLTKQEKPNDWEKEADPKSVKKIQEETSSLKKEKIEEVNKQIPFECLGIWEKVGLLWNKLRKKRTIMPTTICYPTDTVTTFPTQLLGEEENKIKGEFIFEGEGEELGGFSIQQEQVLIGSDSKVCDITLCATTVSRMHARIQQCEGEFYLEDLNSTNGTHQNGEELKYKEKVKLVKNDKIHFANLPYRFV